MLYKVNKKIYRNDYIFSIARHLMSDSREDVFSVNPYKLVTAYPISEIVDVQKNGFIIKDETLDGSIFNLKNESVHMLNKNTILNHYDRFNELFK